MRKLFKERKLFKRGNYMKKYGTYLVSLFLIQIPPLHNALFARDFISNSFVYKVVDINLILDARA